MDHAGPGGAVRGPTAALAAASARRTSAPPAPGCRPRFAARPGDGRVLRASILERIRSVVPFDAYLWVLTDPAATVGAAPLAEVPDRRDLPFLLQLKYLTPINRWTGLARSSAQEAVQEGGAGCEVFLDGPSGRGRAAADHGVDDPLVLGMKR